jgi:hypothetical protein
MHALLTSNRFLRLAVTFASFFPFFRLYEFQGFKKTRVETAKALQGVQRDALKDDTLAEEDLLFIGTVSSRHRFHPTRRLLSNQVTTHTATYENLFTMRDYLEVKTNSSSARPLG